MAHVKAGAVTGLEARLALQKGREEAQGLLKLAQTAIQQQQQQQQQQPPLRSTSFPPRGAPRPIGPQPSQVSPRPAKTINVVQAAVNHPSLLASANCRDYAWHSYLNSLYPIARGTH